MSMLDAMDPRERQRMIDAMVELQRAEARLEREHREAIVYWASVLCACKPRLDRDWPSTGSPPGCVVHGQFMVTPQGRVL